MLLAMRRIYCDSDRRDSKRHRRSRQANGKPESLKSGIGGRSGCTSAGSGFDESNRIPDLSSCCKKPCKRVDTGASLRR